EIKDDTELGLAILVAVSAAGGYRPRGGGGQHRRGARDRGEPLAPLHRRRHREVRVVGAGSGRRLRPAGEQAGRRTAHAYPAENRELAELVDGVVLGGS